MSTKKYVITITSISNEGNGEPESEYEQTVDSLNIRAVIEAVNAEPLLTPAATPVIRRKRKPRSDKGKRRNKTEIIP